MHHLVSDLFQPISYRLSLAYTRRILRRRAESSVAEASCASGSRWTRLQLALSSACTWTRAWRTPRPPRSPSSSKALRSCPRSLTTSGGYGPRRRRAACAYGRACLCVPTAPRSCWAVVPPRFHTPLHRLPQCSAHIA